MPRRTAGRQARRWGLVALRAEEGEGEVDALDLTDPTFGLGLRPALQEVGFQLGEPGEHLGIDVEHRAADACLRCPMININPKMLPRLDEIEDDLLTRRARAEAEGWLGEIEGIDLTLSFLRQKRDQTRQLATVAPVDLGIPGIAPRSAARRE
ncbi:hypothetical protein [Streptomyces sp. NPDC056987]|uniref:hypothetical protein n=1 Tax=Streptomyces sp. NPDC056987 TaxID=3345988 RepID=UPI00362A3A36